MRQPEHDRYVRQWAQVRFYASGQRLPHPLQEKFGMLGAHDFSNLHQNQRQFRCKYELAVGREDFFMLFLRRIRDRYR